MKNRDLGATSRRGVADAGGRGVSRVFVIFRAEYNFLWFCGICIGFVVFLY